MRFGDCDSPPEEDMGNRELTGTATLARVRADRRDNSASSDISSWCNSSGKRLFDLVLATFLLIPALPLMAVIALLVKLTSPGPVLFVQRRAGKDGVEFRFLKFRTMVDGRLQEGPGVTMSGDARVTGVGSFLRRSKLDELPQLFHVVSGKLSLVGPRPDLPKYLASLDHNHRSVLALRPGLTGNASVCFRNEEEVLAQASEGQLEPFYVTHVLPAKVRLDLEYAKTATLWSDIGILFRTFLTVF